MTDPFTITTIVGTKEIEWQKPIPDPLVRHTITIGWLGLLRGLLHGKLCVQVLIDAPRTVVDDVIDACERWREGKR
jgi:hypothetical protein